MTGVLEIFGLSLLAQVFKKYIKPKWGDTGIHIIIFLIAGIVVFVGMKANGSVEWKELLKQMGSWATLTIASYEVILKKVYSLFKK